jgi:hypothetical protein
MARIQISDLSTGSENAITDLQGTQINQIVGGGYAYVAGTSNGCGEGGVIVAGYGNACYGKGGYISGDGHGNYSYNSYSYGSHSCYDS